MNKSAVYLREKQSAIAQWIEPFTQDETTMLIGKDQDYMRRVLREFVQSAYPDKNVFETADGSSALAHSPMVSMRYPFSRIQHLPRPRS